MAITTFDPSTSGTSPAVSLSAAQFAQNGDSIMASYNAAAAAGGTTLDFTVGSTLLATALYGIGGRKHRVLDELGTALRATPFDTLRVTDDDGAA